MVLSLNLGGTTKNYPFEDLTTDGTLVFPQNLNSIIFYSDSDFYISQTANGLLITPDGQIDINSGDTRFRTIGGILHIYPWGSDTIHFSKVGGGADVLIRMVGVL